MARISIEPSKAKQVLNDENSVASLLQRLSGEVDGVRGALRYKIAGQEQIRARLQEAAGQIAKEATSTRALREGLEQVIQLYEQTENGNRDRASAAERTSIQQNSGSGGGLADGGSNEQHNRSLWEDMLGKITMLPFEMTLVGPTPSPLFSLTSLLIKAVDKGYFKASGEVEDKHEGSVDLKKANKDKDKGFFKKLSDWEKNHQKDLGERKRYYKDLKTGVVTNIDDENKKEKDDFSAHNMGIIPIDVKLAGIGAAGSIAFIDNDWKGNTDWGGHEGNVSVAKLEGHADAYLGWGIAGAELGAGFTAFSAEEKLYLGNEDNQIYGKGRVDVGKAEAKAGLSAGVVDREGNFNPSLYAGASAEALGGEASLTLGGKALGTDIGVKGSINYGIGAHANVGLHDGKFSVDLGATLGVGVSVKLDIDVSGTIKGVCDTAGKVWSGVTSLFAW